MKKLWVLMDVNTKKEWRSVECLDSESGEVKVNMDDPLEGLILTKMDTSVILDMTLVAEGVNPNTTDV